MAFFTVFTVPLLLVTAACFAVMLCYGRLAVKRGRADECAERLDLMLEHSVGEDEVQAEWRRFKEQAAAYNQAIEALPWKYLAFVFGFKKIDTT
jgi:hypothetical protein